MVLVKERRTSTLNAVKLGSLSGEVVAFCPVCKAFQTLWFNENGLMPTRKFAQYDNKVFHDCGAKEPCHLYRSC